MLRPRGLEPLTYGLAYHYSFHCLKLIQTDHPNTFPICGLDYIFTISGGTRIVSTDPGVSFSLLYQRQALIRSGMAKQPPVSSVLPAFTKRYGFTDTVSSTSPVLFPDEGSYTTILTQEPGVS